jgi:hypothetical protein
MRKRRVSRTMLQALFNSVAERLDKSNDGCDHTLRHTRASIRKLHLEKQPVLLLLEEYGGYCDCEVLLNSSVHLELIPDLWVSSDPFSGAEV